MQKRNTEGFALAYVAIVIAVLTILVTGLTSISLRILMAQEATTERMQAKYEAQGQVELAVAKIADGAIVSSSSDGDVYESSRSLAISAAGNDAVTAIKALICTNTGNATDKLLCSGPNFSVTGDTATFSCKFPCVKTSGDCSVQATLNLDCEIQILITEDSGTSYTDQTTGETINEIKYLYSYTVTDATLEFVSYEIITKGGAS